MSIERDRPDPPPRFHTQPGTAPIASDQVRRTSAQAASAEQARFERALQKANTQDGARMRGDQRSTDSARQNPSAALLNAGPGASRVPMRDAGIAMRHTASRPQQSDVRSSSVLQARERQDRQTPTALNDNDAAADERNVAAATSDTAAQAVPLSAGSEAGANSDAFGSDAEQPPAGIALMALGAASFMPGDISSTQASSAAGAVSAVQDVVQVLDELAVRGARASDAQVFTLSVEDPDIASLVLTHDATRGWRIDVHTRSGQTSEHTEWCPEALSEALCDSGHRIDEIAFIEAGL